MGLQRTPLVLVNADILSSYQPRSLSGGTGGKRSTLLPLRKLGTVAAVPQDVAAALWATHVKVQAAGGDFRVTDLHRSTESSAQARRKYELWVAAGKPRTRAEGFNPHTMKNAYVARPGRSMHNGARAVDVDIKNLGLPLQTLWDIMIPLGWKPIIKAPDAQASEAWHFDYLGPWSSTYDRLGYEQTAIACALDVGVDCYDRWKWRFIQAQLHRAGYDVGDIDGWPGKKTYGALTAAGIGKQVSLARAMALPSNPATIWTI